MNKNIGIINRLNVDYLDELFINQQGLIQAVPAIVLKEIPHEHLMNWANTREVWQIVTCEQIQWLKEQIGDKKAMEICAGNGVVSSELGIIGVDSRIQEKPYFKKIMEEKFGKDNGLQTTHPPKDIKRYEAIEAIRVFRPDIVIGCFVTPKGPRVEASKGIMCNAYGPDMKELFARIEKYIHFGNQNTHFPNPIYELPHTELSFPWLYTRSFDQSLNRVWIWESTR